MSSNSGSKASQGYPIIDVFNHIYPEEYLEALPPSEYVARQIKANRSFRDIEHRIKIMDNLGINIQVLSLARPTLDDIDNPAQSIKKITNAANDGIAKIVEKYPDRFAGVGTVSLQDVGEAINELDRCIEDLGLLGVQVLSNVGGKPLDLPEFEPFYERLCHHDVPLLIHPTNLRKTYDWVMEFNLFTTLGFDIDTSLAMFRIVRGGLFEKYSKLKIIIHHMGAFIPFLAGRIDRSIVRLQGKGGLPPPPLVKAPMEYLKMFFVDTGEGWWKPALICSQSFFGSEKMLFATDYPFHGDSEPRDIIEAIEELKISEEEKRKIFNENAIKLLKID